MTIPASHLLRAFREVFEGCPYKHRDSSLGDRIASYVYEDLYALGKSAALRTRIEDCTRVVNTQNMPVGRRGRRGDGTFGELVPVATAIEAPGFLVKRGPVATTEIGAETKILAKAMIKQIDRVINDLRHQADEFRRRGGNPICIALIGVNFSERYTSFEGERSFPTDGRTYKHPIQEAKDAIVRLESKARSAFDEFQYLNFRATNEPPYRFEWVDERQTQLEYAALLTRVSREYDRRFA